ncbi:ergothioneine biosynthesis protein EgtB [Roseiconus nitratireducens]|uniref:Ergothioneine biosynthesis protein EgtB n=1 Tax=Roseiconus nitratireducens TaxID=2605748 RepID=A0A5M6CXE9_9BACT|nr:ergothioneine biosynthesis protein EgtB [Roseiconus nitratireducens]KAA5539606.1 ergothioneine biosynthesis protein EgtB [Roseiconus nitratireducens]
MSRTITTENATQDPSAPDPSGVDGQGEGLKQRFHRVRQDSMSITALLHAEDCVIQSMPDASPIRWHLAHTTWFFETFLLKPLAGYQPVNEAFEYLFNSYYNSVGAQFPRHRRGLLSRPTMKSVFEYRQQVDAAVIDWLSRQELTAEQREILEVGLHHEQQHQELMLTDVKHLLSCNPIFPAMFDHPVADQASPASVEWVGFEGGVRRIGHDGNGFAYDNESPRHKVYVHPFRIQSRPVSNREYLAFIQDGGYRRPEHWLSAGWAAVQEGDWQHPLYWCRREAEWHEFTLGGLRRLDPAAPACHLSYFEADAYARWSGHRLPTEAEWEIASQAAAPEQILKGANRFVDSGRPVHPEYDPTDTAALRELFGCLWQWTSSQYSPYPGYSAPEGALGEYNGKFMCNQFVLRGSSCATSANHARRTYRNFFPPEARWQFTGVRLASDGAE